MASARWAINAVSPSSTSAHKTIEHGKAYRLQYTGRAASVQKLSHDGHRCNVAMGRLQRCNNDRHETTFGHPLPSVPSSQDCIPILGPEKSIELPPAPRASERVNGRG